MTSRLTARFSLGAAQFPNAPRPLGDVPFEAMYGFVQQTCNENNKTVGMQVDELRA